MAKLPDSIGRHRSQLRLALTTAVVAAAMAGCGDDDKDPTTPSATGAPVAAETTPAPTSDGDPGGIPLSNPAVSGPKAAVERLMRWTRSGSLANVSTLYDTRVRNAVGTKAIVGALQGQRSIYTTPSIKVTKVEPTELGVLVIVSRQPKGAPAVETSYLLGRRNGRWLVRYDSVLEAGLSTYVQRQVQLRSGKVRSKPSPTAVARGQQAAAEFLALFAPAPLRGRLRVR
jgi:hypothetical protein